MSTLFNSNEMKEVLSYDRDIITGEEACLSSQCTNSCEQVNFVVTKR